MGPLVNRSACTLLLAAIAIAAPAAEPSPSGFVRVRAVAVGESPELRMLPPAPPPERLGPVVAMEVGNPVYGDFNPRQVPFLSSLSSPDEALVDGWRAPLVMPPVGTNWQGLGNATNVQLYNQAVFPPDTVGDVGLDHYVQGTNLNFGIWFKDGNVDPNSQGTFRLRQLFGSMPDVPCRTSDDDGDPIVLYDHLADRWLLSQFEVDVTPKHQCIAISKTADPYGAWWVYDFEMPNDLFNDYPHFGVWPDGYYMTDSEFSSTFDPPDGTGIFAFDRARMLVGDPDASYVYRTLRTLMPGRIGSLPADLDGPAPSSPRPALIAIPISVEQGDAKDGIRLFEFTPNYDNPAASTFTEAIAGGLTVAGFDPVNPDGRDDIPQPGATTDRWLDSVGARFMHRLQYRNFGSYERLTVAHTVDASGDVDPAVYRAGVRYYVLRRNSGGAWAVEQQGTYAPADGVDRWMPSAALDADGNLAIGYNASSTAVFPSLRYAGRLAGDPAGLAQGEGTFYAGTASQQAAGSRWGDYASLSVDPADDCSFWLTGEYYSGNGLECGANQAVCWRTRIGRFKYPGCTANLIGTLSGTVTNANSGLPVPGALIALGNGYYVATAANGTYTKALRSGSYAMGASRSGYQPVTLPAVVVTSGGNTVRNFTMDGAPAFAANGFVIDDAILGNGNGRLDPNECVNLRLRVRNEGGDFATQAIGDIRVTSGVTINDGIATWPDLVPDATTENSQPFDISTASNYAAGKPVDVLLRLQSAELTKAMNYRIPVGVPNGPPIAFPNSGGIRLIQTTDDPDDPRIVDMPIPVAGFDSAIRRITAAVYVTHEYLAFLTLKLIAPDGSEITLADVYTDATAYGASCPAGAGDAVFDDAAGIEIIDAIPPYIGTYRPNGPLSTFVGRSGTQVNGTWRLRAENRSTTFSGALRCATLTLNGYTYTAGVCNRGNDLFANGFE